LDSCSVPSVPVASPPVYKAVNAALTKSIFQVNVGQGSVNYPLTVLVDSGAQVNVIRKGLVTEKGWKSQRGSAIKLRMANGAQVTVRERVTLDLEKGGYKIKCEFLVANIVQEAILGLPWMDKVSITEINPRLGRLSFRSGKEHPKTYTWWASKQEDKDDALG
jgi:hypothetical protein